MRVISFDCESHLIRQGCITPRMVCLTYAERSYGIQESEPYPEDDRIVFVKDGIVRGLMTRAAALPWIRGHLEDDAVILVGHNIWFDLGLCVAASPNLLPLIFRKLELGLIRDTQVRQQLIDIATGSMKFSEDEDTGEITKTTYHLDDLSLRLLKKWLKKKDTWRLKYALLDGVPFAKWPEEAKRYAIEDAVTTLKIYEEQDVVAGVSAVLEGAIGPDGKERSACDATCSEIPDAARQHRAAWALHLMSAWGVRTDGAMVATLKKRLEADYDEFTEKLRPSGFLKFAPERALKSGPRKGLVIPAEVTKDTKTIKARVEAAFAAKGEDVPRTDASDKFPEGQVSTSKKTLLASGDPELKTLSERGAIAKLLETYVPILESGTKWPINPRYNVLVETGRTSSSKPNIQNPPRKGGVRECFIPRDGWVYAFSDYDTIELKSLAQVCLDVLGWSDMAEALKRGEDLHLKLAGQMLDISYEEALRRQEANDSVVDEHRQQAKPANFGYPGGMAADSFREYAEQYGIFLTKQRAQEIKDTWKRTFREMDPYFAWVSGLVDAEGPITQVRSGRVRGGASFCAAANGFFQGLAADGAKEALWLVAKECYLADAGDNGGASPLYGCRPVFFIHDEIGIEIPYRAWGAERSAAAAERLKDVMVEAMKKWIPDIPITSKPIMCRRWYKGAKPVKSGGVLVPSKPEKYEENGEKKTRWVPDLDERVAA